METQMEPKEQSDFGKLTNSLDSLKSTLRTFEGDMVKFRAHLFTEELAQSPDGEREMPKNKIAGLSQIVDDCSDIQKKIREDFEKIRHLLE